MIIIFSLLNAAIVLLLVWLFFKATENNIKSVIEENHGCLHDELDRIRKKVSACAKNDGNIDIITDGWYRHGKPVKIPSMWDDPAYIKSITTDDDDTISAKWGLEPHAFGRTIFTDPQLARYNGGLKTLYLKQFVREMKRHFKDRIEVLESTKHENPDYQQEVDELKDTIYRIKRFYDQHPWRAKRHEKNN